jgi:hypothetical protein
MDVDIEVAIRNRDWGLVARCASQSGKHKGRPSKQIKIELKAYVNSLRDFGHDWVEIEREVLNWIG